MIISKQKPLSEIVKMVANHKKVLVLGCGTCATVCLAGGEKQVATLASNLRLAQKLNGGDKQFTEHTITRQCEREFLDEIADKLKDVDAVISLSCGIGIQTIAEFFPTLHVIPGVDTAFLGRPEGVGVWSERCLACGSCLLNRTGSICPVTRCAKGLLNGPCGGSVNGKCEVDPNTPCVWQLIIDRLTALGQLDQLEEIEPLKDWSTSNSGGPRKVVID